MYHIDAVEVEKDSKLWGDFTVIKDFKITKQVNVTHSKSTAVNVDELTNIVSGFIIQHVKKTTTLHVLCKDNVLQKIENIDAFTSNRVKYMNHAYYELFPVIDGKSIYLDSFQNGAVLRYEKDKTKWYANNNPPTKGKIIQEGTSYFIPTEKSIVKHVITKINESSRKRSTIPIILLGIEWDMNPTLPANGLPYTTTNIEYLINDLKKSNSVHHTVHVEWNGISSNNNKNKQNKNKNNNTYVCESLNETNNESNKRIASTQLKSNITNI